MLVRDGTLWPMRMLRTYKVLRTLLFMVCSGVIIDSMYLNSESAFWLFKPLKKYSKRIYAANGTHKANGSNGIHRENGTHIPHEINATNATSKAVKCVCHHKNSCNTHIYQVHSQSTSSLPLSSALYFYLFPIV